MKEGTRINGVRANHRIVAVLLTIALVFCAALALSGCQSKEQQAEASVKALLDDYKNGSVDLLSSGNAEELADMNLDVQELASILTEDFSYDIKGSKENSETGNIDVEVTIHSKQLSGAITKALPDMLTYAFGASLSGMSEADIQKQLMSIILEKLKTEEAVDTTVTVPVAEESGDLVATDEGKKAILSAIVGNMDEVNSALNGSGDASSQA